MNFWLKFNFQKEPILLESNPKEKFCLTFNWQTFPPSNKPWNSFLLLSLPTRSNFFSQTFSSITWPAFFVLSSSFCCLKKFWLQALSTNFLWSEIFLDNLIFGDLWIKETFLFFNWAFSTRLAAFWEI